MRSAMSPVDPALDAPDVKATSPVEAFDAADFALTSPLVPKVPTPELKSTWPPPPAAPTPAVTDNIPPLAPDPLLASNTPPVAGVLAEATPAFREIEAPEPIALVLARTFREPAAPGVDPVDICSDPDEVPLAIPVRSASEPLELVAVPFMLMRFTSPLRLV